MGTDERVQDAADNEDMAMLEADDALGFVPDEPSLDDVPFDAYGEIDSYVEDEYFDQIEFTEEGKSLDDLTPQEIGELGENMARLYLEERGYEILECNMRNNGGECDIVCSIGDEVVLVEVKTRTARDDRYGCIPELAVDQEKQKRYREMALWYLLEHDEASRIRFDVIAVSITHRRKVNLRHLVGAFGCDS